jgi:hypothetical protein
MRIDEIAGFEKPDIQKKLADVKAKEQELKVLANKTKQMYTKALANYEEVESKNAEKFDTDPFNSFNGWFTHMFKADVSKLFAIPNLQIQDNNIKKLGKLIIAYASQNYFLKPKTPFAGADTFLKICKAVDSNLLTMADQVLGRFVRGEEAKNPTPVPNDMKAVIQNLTPEQKKQLNDLISKAGGKA